MRFGAIPVATVSGTVQTLIVGFVLVLLLVSALVAAYGRTLGYPVFPVFVCSLFLGFPIVLLVLVIAAGRRRRDCPVCGEGVARGRRVCGRCGYDFASGGHVPPIAR